MSPSYLRRKTIVPNPRENHYIRTHRSLPRMKSPRTTLRRLSKFVIYSGRLKRKHNLLRAIVRTNQNDNSSEGVSDYDQSFKRLYDNFKSIYAKPILEARNFVIDDAFNEIPLTPNIPMIQKATTTISNKKRI